MPPTLTLRIPPVAVFEDITAAVHVTVDQLLQNECTISQGSIEDGHVIVKDGETKVYQALQSGPPKQWIVSCYNSLRITWTKKD